MSAEIPVEDRIAGGKDGVGPQDEVGAEGNRVLPPPDPEDEQQDRDHTATDERQKGSDEYESQVLVSDEETQEERQFDVPISEASAGNERDDEQPHEVRRAADEALSELTEVAVEQRTGQQHRPGAVFEKYRVLVKTNIFVARPQISSLTDDFDGTV